MLEVVNRIADAVFSQCGGLTIIGWMIAFYLVWVNYRINEAREKERAEFSADAHARIQAFESLALSLSEMRGFLSALAARREL
jgi:threonine/homoserine/homoserine lactone efflux protein